MKWLEYLIETFEKHPVYRLILIITALAAFFALIKLDDKKSPLPPPPPADTLIRQEPKPVKEDTTSTPQQYAEIIDSSANNDLVEETILNNDKKANGYFVEIVTDSSENMNTSGLDEIKKVTVSPPQKGYGKIIFRNICQHCDWISITMPRETGQVDNPIELSRYNPNRKWETSKTFEYLPRVYNATIKSPYHEETREIAVKEGKVIIYYYNKINPYKPKCGRVAFISRRPTRKFFVTVTHYNKSEIIGYGSVRGITKSAIKIPLNKSGEVDVKMFQKSILYFDIPTNHYRFTAIDRETREDDPNEPLVEDDVHVQEGFLKVIYID